MVTQKITCSVSKEDANFFKEENISPSAVLQEHAKNLRGLLGIKYNAVVAEKSAKIQLLGAELSRLSQQLALIMPDEDFKAFMKGGTK